MTEWLSLLSPLPHDAAVVRKPVASAEQLANGTAGPIAGWYSLSVNLFRPLVGSRNVLVTLDEGGAVLSAGDHIMLMREVTRDGIARLTDHESIGGRYDDDVFRGTCWKMRMKSRDDSDEPETLSSEQSPPTTEQAAALRRLVDDVIARTPKD